MTVTFFTVPVCGKFGVRGVGSSVAAHTAGSLMLFLITCAFKLILLQFSDLLS